MDPKRLKSAWRLIPTTVGILILKNSKDNYSGITINSFFSVSIDHSILAVSLSNNSNTMKYMDKEKVFSISVLNSSQKDYADFFSKKDKEIVPTNLLFNTSDKGIRSIKDASIVFYCKWDSSNIVKDHTIIYSKIFDVEFNNNDPLIWKF